MAVPKSLTTLRVRLIALFCLLLAVTLFHTCANFLADWRRIAQARDIDAVGHSVVAVSNLVQEIAAASQEQGQGVGQINGAMGQLNQATQQNAAASEELAATAEEMGGQAARLQDLMKIFRVA